MRPAGPKADRAYGTDELVKTIEGVTCLDDESAGLGPRVSVELNL